MVKEIHPPLVHSLAWGGFFLEKYKSVDKGGMTSFDLLQFITHKPVLHTIPFTHALLESIKKIHP